MSSQYIGSTCSPAAECYSSDPIHMEVNMDKNALWLFRGQKIYWRGHPAKFYFSPTENAWLRVNGERFERYLQMIGAEIVQVTKDDIVQVKSKMNWVAVRQFSDILLIP